jgi:hypothetical protein
MIEDRHGNKYYAAATDKIITGEIFEYVSEKWDEIDMGTIPDDPDAAIEEYFAQMAGSEWLANEWITINGGLLLLAWDNLKYRVRSHPWRWKLPKLWHFILYGESARERYGYRQHGSY